MNPVAAPAYMIGPAHRPRAGLPPAERTGSSTDEQGR